MEPGAAPTRRITVSALLRSGVGGTALIAGGVVLVCAGCSASPTPGPLPKKTSAAQALCDRALGPHALPGTSTTVGQMRSWKMGPNLTPARDAFPGFADQAPGAWCWDKSGSIYRAFAVGPGGVTLQVLEASGLSSAPSGPPVAP